MLQNILGAVGVALNGLAAILLATSFEFAAFPSVLLFTVGAAGMLIFGQVSPLMMQTEIIVLAGSFGRNRDERLSICVYAGILTFILGLTGVVGRVVNFVGDQILYGIMAGVGIMLAYVSINMVKENMKVGIISVIAGVATYLLTEDIIYTTVAAILSSGIYWNIFHKEEIKNTPLPDMSMERFRLTHLTFEPSMLRGALAITTLLVGAIISEGAINAMLAGGEADFDALTIYAGFGSILSPLFGGIPGGVIVTGTATAPNPILSGVLLMAIISVILLTRLTPHFKRYLPGQCVAGLLFVLGVFIIFPGNAATSLSETPLIGGVTMLMTAIIDPFAGLCAGLAMKMALAFLA